ncbi:MAG: hypothetical protein DHS20C08_08750 [Rhodomicrobium sp.]|nr:MAG: hypothetical protein DHS20C08_08750 [Rhodomicrobium sp.]
MGNHSRVIHRLRMLKRLHIPRRLRVLKVNLVRWVLPPIGILANKLRKRPAVLMRRLPKLLISLAR